MEKWIFDDKNGTLYNLASKSEITFDILEKKQKGVMQGFEFAIFWTNQDGTEEVIYFDLFYNFVNLIKKMNEKWDCPEDEYLGLDEDTKMLLTEKVARAFVNKKMLSFFDINYIIREGMEIQDQ